MTLGIRAHLRPPRHGDMTHLGLVHTTYKSDKKGDCTYEHGDVDDLGDGLLVTSV